ncbi:hypothetical protein BE08_05205 [Sorangium cellulosum]|uniref:Uncharacterized protein n=1 Tax=Sorangium cellulosum TaxID=56 RepID=A0A150PD23_SORCE|nr:hypothetical protein BE08_05205 [Sorangium cellulosum]
MWQGSQTAFLDEAGGPCEGLIAIAVGDRAVCYGGPGGVLRCAGRIYTHNFGPQFTDVPGAPPVAQILISPTFNSEDGNAMCVRTPGGEVQCMGRSNSWGQFGNGTSDPSASFVPWGTSVRAVGIATGTWDQICALTVGGEALCSGHSHGTSPVSVGSASRSVAIDTFGRALLDEPDLYRMENGRAECHVGPDGFQCRESAGGAPGDVVDGTYADRVGRSCWLTAAGKVECAVTNRLDPGVPPQPLAPFFTRRPVLALAGNFYTDSICAVYDDGSIACFGSNDHGQLGVADEKLAAEAIVQPPGSIDLRCE